MGTGGISRELNCSYAAVRWIPPSLFAISKPFGAHRHDGHGWCHYLCGTAQPLQRQRGHPAASSLVLYQTGTTCGLWGTTKYEWPQISSHKVLAWGGGAASHMQDPSVGSYLLGWPLTAPPAAALGKTLAPLPGFHHLQTSINSNHQWGCSENSLCCNAFHWQTALVALSVTVITLGFPSSLFGKAAAFRRVG